MAPLHLIGFLSLMLGIIAVDVRLYEDSTNCQSDFLSCNNQPEGQCCFGAGLYESCEATEEKSIQAFSRQGGSICGALLGGSFECWGVSNGIASISGCSWSERSRLGKSEKRTTGANVCSGKYVYATHVGKWVGNKVYMMDMDRIEYQVYRNLTTSEDQAMYITDHADIIQDF